MIQKKDMNFENICFYETGKAVMSACIMSSSVRWRRILCYLILYIFLLRNFYILG